MRYKAGQIGLVLGVILIIMGFATSNVGEWMLGIILLALGIFDYIQKSKQKPPVKDMRYSDAMKEVIENKENKK